ncbi:MAG: hypothetical protein HYZ68_05920 [Chloroflexi bacterium]|nr:hypothetical protein [Chloroflexota bacterium]
MDLRERARGSQSAWERLVGAIPGYRGYKEKELRREADKLLRGHLARRFEEERDRLNALQVRLADRGQFQHLVSLERAVMKLQLLIDRLKTANYGYAGWFDAVKVHEGELDALYEHDRALMEGVDKVDQGITHMAAATEEGVIVAVSEVLLETLDELNTYFSRRMDLILGLEAAVKGPPSATQAPEREPHRRKGGKSSTS